MRENKPLITDHFPPLKRRAKHHVTFRCADGQACCRWSLAICFLFIPGFLLHCVPALSQTGTSSTEAGPHAATQPDGQHDFDFNIGAWKTHITRILDPFSGSTNSIELNGTVTVRRVWDGRAQLEEIEADGPNGHWEGLTLFLYNPQSHQWSQTFASSKSGTLTSPLIGAFKNGRGELFAQDTFDGKSILVRGVWSDITPGSHRFEESYSDDGGRTWEAAFIASLTR